MSNEILKGFEEAPSLDDILDGTIVGTTPADAANSIAKKNYQRLVALQNVSSYSMQQVFFRCPREYQWNKLAAFTGTTEREDNVDHAFGHAIGAGIAVFDQTQDLQKAKFAAFLAWGIDLWATDSYKRSPKDKSFHNVWLALELYPRFWAEELSLFEYEIVDIEATLAIDLENGSFYTGHIDEVLRHRERGSFLVKENKTTGDSLVDPAKYSNSEQTVSYSTVIDHLGGQDYDVLYCVYSSLERKWISFTFPKTKLAKAEWLQDQLFIADDIERFSDADFFPKRGSSCLRFGRQCEHYGTCDLQTNKVFGMRFQDLPRVVQATDLDEIEHYKYKLKLSELVEVLKEKEF